MQRLCVTLEVCPNNIPIGIYLPNIIDDIIPNTPKVSRHKIKENLTIQGRRLKE